MWIKEIIADISTDYRLDSYVAKELLKKILENLKNKEETKDERDKPG